MRGEVLRGSFTIERSYAAPPAQVFGAFADEASERRWFAEGNGLELYLDIVPNERIVFAT